MPTPDFATFTGIDARTDVNRVRALSHRYPIEWGILFSPKKQGLDPRYPAADVISAIVPNLVNVRDPHIMLSAHICGQHSADIMAGVDPNIDLTKFGRTQINTAKPDFEMVAAFGRSHGVRAITQCRDQTFPEDYTVAWLYDCSGGRGDLPDTWPPHPADGRLVGFAGGLNPENVAQVNATIASTGQYWLDMETGVRTDDWLDLDKCEAVCKALFVN